MQILAVHPTHPQVRLLRQAVDVLQRGGLIVYPTDTTYALGCHIGDKHALERLVALRKLPKRHQFTLACRDLSELGTYARVDNAEYRILKRFTPGPFTWVLKATKQVPKRLVHEKRRTIGLRVPGHPIVQALLELLGEPIMTTSARLPEQTEAFTEAVDLAEAFGKQVDLVIDGGPCGDEPSTMVDLTTHIPEVMRQGVGDLEGII